MDFIGVELCCERLIAVNKQTKAELLEFYNRMADVDIQNCAVMKFTTTPHSPCGWGVSPPPCHSPTHRGRGESSYELHNCTILLSHIHHSVIKFVPGKLSVGGIFPVELS